MSRYKYQSTVIDANDGRIIGEATVSIYLAGTTTAATVYTAAVGGVGVSSVETDISGFFEFWVDLLDYRSSQAFKIIANKTSFVTQTYDGVVVFPDLSGSIRDYGSDLELAVSEIGSDVVSLEIDGTVLDLTGDLVIPSTLSLYWKADSTLGGAYTLTYNGTIIAGQYQIFDSALTVVGLEESKPEWWGAVGDGVVDCTTAIQDALDSSDIVICSVGTYLITAIVDVPADTVLKGLNRETCIIQNDTTPISIRFSGSSVIDSSCENLKVINTVATYGRTVFVDNGASYIEVSDCNIESAYRPFGVTDSASPLSAHHVVFRNNKTLSTHIDGGLRTRVGGDDIENSFVSFLNNDITISNAVDEDIGIEAWTGGTLVLNNRITATNFKGGYSGITFGIKENQTAMGNTIKGFSLGIEMGGTEQGLHIISGNLISGCQSGISVTTSGIEEAIQIVNNVIEFDDALRTDYEDGISTKCKATSLIGNTIIHKDTSDTPAWTSYLDTDSRQYRAIYADTEHVSLSVLGNIIKNFEDGITAAATSGDNVISGNQIENVGRPINDVGSLPNNFLVGNTFLNFDQCRINSFLSAIGNSFKRASDYVVPSAAALATCPYATGYDTNDVLMINKGNSFENVNPTTFAQDAQYAETGAGYKRPDIELADNFVTVTNTADPAAIRTLFTTFNKEIKGVTVKTWSNNDVFIFNETNVKTSLSAAPVAGTWLQGDIVEDTAPAAGGFLGWVCTAGGTPGTWKTYGVISP